MAIQLLWHKYPFFQLWFKYSFDYTLSLSGSAASSEADNQPKQDEEPAAGVQGLDITKEDGVLTMTFNRPKKLNAITHEVCFLSLLSSLSGSIQKIYCGK